jgi:hypothetical protein
MSNVGTGNDSLLNSAWYLPAGTNGTAGTSGSYALFGEFPQTIKASGVTVNESQTKTSGSYTYYKGSDGAWYAKVSSNYYKVEPIKWRVVTTNYGGKKLLLAENILRGYWFDDDSNTYSNSEISFYLSGTFLSSAFTSGSQSLMAITTVDSVSDRIFLLSNSEAENTSYFSGNSSRIRMPTDFAKANGAQEPPESGQGGWWWLRTASSEGNAISACDVHSGGNIAHYSVSNESGGVVPALCLNN